MSSRMLCKFVHISICLLCFESLYFSFEVSAFADPVKMVIDGYYSQNFDQKTENERVQIYSDWSQRLVSVAKENPASEYSQAAFVEASRICNLLGDYNQSENILETLINNSKSLDDRVEFLTELAEVQQIDYFSNRLEPKRKRSIENFLRTIPLIDEQLNLLQNQIKNETVVDIKEMLTTKLHRQKEQQILNLVWAGDLYQVNATSDNEQVLAFKSYLHARELYEKYGSPKFRLVSANCTLEKVAFSEAVAAAISKDIASSKIALSFLDKLQKKQHPTSFYIKQVAETAFLPCSKNLINFVLECINEFPEDNRTCILVYIAAEALMCSSPPDFFQALPLLESLENGPYTSSLMEIDKESFLTGTSGYYANVLLFLERIYSSTKDNHKALNSINRFLELFPNYEDTGTINTAKLNQSTLQKDEQKTAIINEIVNKNKSTQSSRLKLIVAINIVILLIVFIGFILSRLKKKS